MMDMALADNDQGVEVGVACVFHNGCHDSIVASVVIDLRHRKILFGIPQMDFFPEKLRYRHDGRRGTQCGQQENLVFFQQAPRCGEY